MMAVTKSSHKEQAPLQKIIADKVIKDHDNVTGYLKCAYYLAKQELPKGQFPAILDLMDFVGSNIKIEGRATYTSHQSVTEFQSALADTILQDKVADIKHAKQFSISIDESTDLGNKKRLLTCINYVHDGEVRCCLLSNAQILESTANAEVIVRKVLDELKTKGLDITNMVGIGTDGASVMTGRHAGVVVKLREHSPALVGVHCAAHRCALAASQAAKSIPEIQSYSRTISNIFFYYTSSALRSNRLKEIQKLLELPELKYAEVHSVRWLSLQKAVEVMYRTYPALVVALSHEAASNATAKGLLFEVRQFRFIAFTHLLMDILPFLSRLSKVFQTTSLDFSKLRPAVESTVNALKDLKTFDGQYVTKLDQYAVCEGESESVVYRRPASESAKKTVDANVDANMLLVDGFDGFDEEDVENDEEAGASVSSAHDVEIHYYTQQKDLLKRVVPLYVDKIVDNLESRFVETDIVEKMQVLVPTNIVCAKKGGSVFGVYGMEEVGKLSEHFGERHGIVKDECTSEYRQYKQLVVGSYPSLTLAECTKAVLSKYTDILPNMAQLLKIAITIPVSSVPCERGFSTQNRIISKFRTKINNDTLNDLMRISEDGPPQREFDFEKALLRWKSEKVRRIYQQ
jgi:hypothetical protein